MGNSFIPFILILLSLAVLVTIIIKKFPQLTLLDIENLPEVKEEQKKNEYLKRRVAKRAGETRLAWSSFFSAFLAPRFDTVQTRFRRWVGRIEKKARDRKKNIPLATQYEQGMETRSMLQEAQLAFERSDFETAERKFIAVVRVEPKNAQAYLGLGDVYLAQGQFKEAEETFKFLLQLSPTDEHALSELGRIAEEQGRIDDAVNYYEQAVLLNDHKAPRFYKIAELLKGIGQNDTALEAIKQAVELEPQNPKYLDFLAETSILVGDKNLAEEAMQQLRMVNPENQKLAIFKDKIGQMPR